MKYPLTVKEVQRVIDLCRSHSLVTDATGSTFLKQVLDDAQTTLHIAQGKTPERLSIHVKSSLGAAYGEVLREFFLALYSLNESEFLSMSQVNYAKMMNDDAAAFLGVERSAFNYWCNVFVTGKPVVQPVFKKVWGKGVEFTYYRLGKKLAA